MRIIPQRDIHFDEIVRTLKDGGTIVYPTETCYGLGCDALNAAAVEKVFAIKGRESGKSVLMIASDIEMVKDCVDWGDTIDELAKKYWPGALTMLLPFKGRKNFAPGVVSRDNAVAFRVTAHPFAHELVAAFGSPLVSTSANAAGGLNPYTIEAVANAFRGQQVQPDIAIDAGELPVRPPSTIVNVSGSTVTVVRQGEFVIE